MEQQRTINVGEQTLTYTLRKSTRAKRVRLTVSRDGSIRVTVPSWFGENVAETFVREHTRWIFAKMSFLKTFSLGPVLPRGRGHYLKHKESARIFIQGRVAHYRDSYGFTPRSINIRNQKTRWGSCSKNGDLNFNYKIFFLPQHLADYVIVHELCHLKEFNHSKEFWCVVESIIPDYMAARKEIIKYRI